MKKFLISSVWLCLLPLRAMDVNLEVAEVTPWQEIVSQENVEAYNKSRDISAEEVREWRSQYDLLWKPKLSSQEFNNFFLPIAKVIYLHSLKDLSEVLPETANNIYFIEIFEYVEKKLVSYAKKRFNLSVKNKHTIFSVGRNKNNSMVIHRGQNYVSRVHLFITGLPDGSGLVLDPFSIGGTKELNEHEIGEYKKDRADYVLNNKMTDEGTRNVFIKRFSSEEPLWLRMGMNIVKIEAARK